MLRQRCFGVGGDCLTVVLHSSRRHSDALMTHWSGSSKCTIYIQVFAIKYVYILVLLWSRHQTDMCRYLPLPSLRLRLALTQFSHFLYCTRILFGSHQTKINNSPFELQIVYRCCNDFFFRSFFSDALRALCSALTFICIVFSTLVFFYVRQFSSCRYSDWFCFDVFMV